MSFLLNADLSAFDKFIEIIKVFVLGIVEGITEWLPVSSTGHLILVEDLLKFRTSEGFFDLFLVVIQLGAIAAVPVLFWDKIYPFSRKKTAEERKKIYGLWLKVIVGVMPAAVLGLLLDDILEEYLLNSVVVAIALIVYGIAFILIEHFKKGKEYRIDSVYDITCRDALAIGAFQCLSLVPGTSRSGSTILGGMLSGVSRAAASEFSFFMAIPVMLGASGLKTVKFFLDGGSLTGFEWLLLALGVIFSFVISLVAIKFLMSFVKRHSFAPFGIYRIILGIAVLVYFIVGMLNA